MGSPTEELAKFVNNTRLEDIPLAVRDVVKESVLDSLGAAVAAASDEEVQSIVREIGAHDSGEESSVWGTRRRSSLLTAPLLNGISAHALELDDVHRESKVHPGAVVVPAAVAVGESLSASGRQLLEAVAVGYEVAIRVGKGIGATGHRLRGWHATGTVGTFGAAAAAAKLLALDMSQTVSALGLAGTQSAGVWAFKADGATCKKLHAGKSAQSGVIAALLARAGMTGPSRILDAEDGGLFVATSEGYDFGTVTAELGVRWLLNEVERKPYACCRSMHPAIDAALEIRKAHGVQPSEVERVEVRTYLVAVKQCALPRVPRTPAEARFSLPYGVAVALVDGQALPRQFSSERIADPEVQALAARVTVMEDRKFTARYPSEWGCEVLVATRRGQSYRVTIRHARGSPEVPLGREGLREKFFGLASPAIGQQHAEGVYELCVVLEDVEDVRKITQLLQPAV